MWLKSDQNLNRVLAKWLKELSGLTQVWDSFTFVWWDKIVLFVLCLTNMKMIPGVIYNQGNKHPKRLMNEPFLLLVRAVKNKHNFNCPLDSLDNLHMHFNDLKIYLSLLRYIQMCRIILFLWLSPIILLTWSFSAHSAKLQLGFSIHFAVLTISPVSYNVLHNIQQQTGAILETCH